MYRRKMFKYLTTGPCGVWTEQKGGGDSDGDYRSLQRILKQAFEID